MPPGLTVALDHIMFIGVMTNALFAALNAATRERADVWAWAAYAMRLRSGEARALSPAPTT